MASFKICLRFSVMPGLTRHPESYRTENNGCRVKPGMTVALNGSALINTTFSRKPATKGQR
jgi:hypothetical protein